MKHTHADQGIGDIANCVQSDLGSDSMFRSVNVQVCKKKEKRGNKKSPVPYFLCCYFNYVLFELSLIRTNMS